MSLYFIDLMPVNNDILGINTITDLEKIQMKTGVLCWSLFYGVLGSIFIVVSGKTGVSPDYDEELDEKKEEQIEEVQHYAASES